MAAPVLIENLRNLIEALPEPATVQTASGTLVCANRLAVELCGFEKLEDMLAAPASVYAERYRFFTESGEPFAIESLPGRRVLAGETEAEVTARVFNQQTGRTTWSLIRARAVRGENGERWALNVIRDLTAQMKAAHSAKLLLASSARLSVSLDPRRALAEIAKSVVPDFSDWCTVFLLDEGNPEVSYSSVAHSDPERVRQAEELMTRYPSRMDQDAGLWRLIKTGEPVLFGELGDDDLIRGSSDPEHLEGLRGMGLRSLIVVPLVARNRVLGALTFSQAESGRIFDNADFGTARELGLQAGIALENSRLFQALQSNEDALRLANQTLTQVMQELSIEQIRLRAVIQQLPVGVVIAEAPSGRIVLRNERLEEILGTPRATHPPLGLGELCGMSPDGRVYAAHEWPLARTISSGELIRNEEIVLTQPSGARRVVSVNARPIQDPGGRIIAGVSVVRDVTDQKLAEEELVRAREAALEASRLKTEFIANMSHEIRTPINSVIGMTGFLADSELSSEQRDYVEAIRHSADSLLTIVNDILDFSKIESGKVDLDLSDFSIRSVVEEVTRILGFTAKLKGIALEADIDQGIPRFVHGDAGKVRQVLMNLVSNAVKFTSEGKVTIHARVSGPRAGGGIEAKLEVRDTGIGVPAEALSRIFDSFTQADSSTTRKYGGTGLGLAISKRLCEVMGGSVGVDSEAGKGSVFWFAVPLEAAKGEARSEAGRRERGKDARAATLETAARILVAEDNPISQKVVTKTLEKLGYRSRAVSSGLEVLEVLATSQERYDLILMDCQMPDLDGYEATREIRNHQNAAIRAIPIVALTAHAVKGDRERCLAVGMNDYLAKPIEPELLDASIRRWLASRTPGAVDLPALESLQKFQQNGQPDIIVELIELFLESTPDRITQMRAAFDTRELGALGRHAHTLKSSGANLGAHALADVCRELEELVNSGASEMDVGSVLSRLENEYQRVREELKSVSDWRKNRGGDRPHAAREDSSNSGR